VTIKGIFSGVVDFPMRDAEAHGRHQKEEGDDELDVVKPGATTNVRMEDDH
jgi:hypothetical protein